MCIPVGYGGPHAGFFAVKRALIKLIPGRIVGQTKYVVIYLHVCIYACVCMYTYI